MENANTILRNLKQGFKTLKVDSSYKKSALSFLESWLADNEFRDYAPQIKYMVSCKDWDYLLDCFYQVIPFGTGGRRGEVGIGPNRINKWTVQASAQGHSQYLLGIYGDAAKKRGVVLAYGIREFFSNKHFSDNFPNPVKNLKGQDLAVAAAEVYAANGIKTYLFESPRTTPELSFAIRQLKAVAGDMFDASHNPPEHNGKKVYDEFGGQLIPPDDEMLVKEVTRKVEEIKIINLDEARKKGLVESVGEEIDSSYIKEVTKLSLSDARDINIIFTPLHGVGATSVVKSLRSLGFRVSEDPKTSNPSGKFENITFNIPNPEVIESFDTTLKLATQENADIILNSDPDGDRIGVMVKDGKDWVYLNGNEIGSILTRYVIEKKAKKLNGQGVVIKTAVTTNLATQICRANDIMLIGELPVGFKYIGEEMNKLEKSAKIQNFLLGLEESHGFIAGNYLRDKDGAIGALWLAELAAELKKTGKTLVDYLDDTYAMYGYYRNYLTEIRLPGAEGMTQIKKIQDTLRDKKPGRFENFDVEKIEDFLDRLPIVSETDKTTKDVLVFHIKTKKGLVNMKVTVRPSGTEPKIKMYFEIGNEPCNPREFQRIKSETEELLKNLEKAFMRVCYKIISIDFPERGFLLFWQLPLNDKLKFFSVEPEIEKIKEEKDKSKKLKKLNELLEFLGTDAIEKVDKAFRAKYKLPIKEYLNL